MGERWQEPKADASSYQLLSGSSRHVIRLKPHLIWLQPLIERFGSRSPSAPNWGVMKSATASGHVSLRDPQPSSDRFQSAILTSSTGINEATSRAEGQNAFAPSTKKHAANAPQ